MNKIVSALALSLLPLLAIADDQVAAAPPQLDADPTGLILFAVVMVGMIGGFAAYIWMKENKRKGAAK